MRLPSRPPSVNVVQTDGTGLDTAFITGLGSGFHIALGDNTSVPVEVVGFSVD